MSISVFTSVGKGYGSFPKFDVYSGQNNDPPEYWQYLKFIGAGDVDYTIQVGDALEFGIFCPSPIGGGAAVGGIEPPGTSAPNETRDNPFQLMPVYLNYGIDLVFTNRIRTSQFGLVDQNGIEVASGNKYPRALDRWYKIVADLSFFAGFEIDYPTVVNENDYGGDTAPTPDIIWTRYIVQYQNILIRNQGTGIVQKYLYQSGPLPGVAASDFQFPYTGSILWTLEAGVPFATTFLEGVSADLFSGPLAMPTRNAASNTTFGLTDYHVVLDTTGATRTATLPAAGTVALGQRYKITKSVAANTATIAAAGTDTINGSASKSVTGQWEYIEVERAVGAGVWLVSASNPAGV